LKSIDVNDNEKKLIEKIKENQVSLEEENEIKVALDDQREKLKEQMEDNSYDNNN